jgi:hypothetical protein
MIFPASVEVSACGATALSACATDETSAASSIRQDRQARQIKRGDGESFVFIRHREHAAMRALKPHRTLHEGRLFPSQAALSVNFKIPIMADAVG